MQWVAKVIEWLKRTFETEAGHPDWKAITACVSIVYIVQSGVAQQYWGKEPNMEIYNSFWWIVIIIAGLSTEMISIMSKIPFKLKKDEAQPGDRSTTDSNINSNNTTEQVQPDNK
jgi:hypothetical protein